MKAYTPSESGCIARGFTVGVSDIDPCARHRRYPGDYYLLGEVT